MAQYLAVLMDQNKTRAVVLSQVTHIESILDGSGARFGLVGGEYVSFNTLDFTEACEAVAAAQPRQ